MTRAATLPIAQIEVSPFNVRTNEVDANDVAGLEASILENGLLEPIIVHPMDGDPVDGHRFGALAGGRRTRSIRNLVERGALPADWPVPVIVHEDLEPAQLLELSLSENMLRRDLRDYEVFAAVAAMHRQGEPPEQIARALGQRQQWVDQALRLGNLAADVFLAFEAGKIDLEQARAFGATADLDLQAQAWAALGSGPPHARTPAAIRAWYRIEDREAEKLLRFVGPDAYAAAGGWYEHDLFDTGADGRGRVSDDPLLRQLADAKVASLRASIRERTGREELRFQPSPPSGVYGGPEWALHITPTEEGDRVVLPDGDIVATIAIDDAGEAEVSYWWASRRAMDGDKPRTARRERVAAGSAIGQQYDGSRQKADAAIKEEAGLTQEGTATMRSLRRMILRAAIVQKAHEGSTLGRDYLVWAQLRMLLSTSGKYGHAEGPAEVGMRALHSPDPDAPGALPLIRDSEAGKTWSKAMETLSKQGFLTDSDLGRAFIAYRRATPAIQELAAAVVAAIALERSLDADGYRVPVHDVVGAQAGLATQQGIRHWWTPTGPFLNLLPTAERAAIAEPFVERVTFASYGRLKSDELTPAVLRVVTGGASETRKMQQLAAAQWVHPLLSFQPDPGVGRLPVQQLEAAE
ncbi:ParB/RepB/Spo0J family partition protein [Sphingomonas jejuensis]|uniref:ParB/RepB/Spo0J family partition protein n=1 Tax=Sphingomonas jejuensis TaxID=904715 RepID=A0ABX0XKM4_9SPHN|nr:ParB/RepB/Spo0J family partition protein [Sphingomonas jejuensis]NJC33898.1 ParB/RepB/Spo0J family partition protein [Sphingomonas jejuensis]